MLSELLLTEMARLRQRDSMPLHRQLYEAMRRALLDGKLSAGDRLPSSRELTQDLQLSRNTVVYGGGGEMRWEKLADGERLGLRLSFEDKGPGIADVPLALTDGYTSGKGLGIGLSGSKRLVNEFDIRTVVGEGTRVTIARWK